MSHRARAIPLSFICGAILVGACVEIPTGTDEVLSFQFNPLPSPSVVVGDTLRDSSGVVAPITFTAFNYSGGIVTNPPVRFTAVDRGIRVDSLKGTVIGDSVRSAARIVATMKGFNGAVMIAVTLRPDTVVGSNARDSLSYSLTDTAANVSAGLGVRVIHGPFGSDTAVASYPVTFRILSPSDTVLAKLVNDNGARSSSDTTDASGVATRKIKLDVTRLTALVDSVIVEARVRYRGASVKGSPVKLVLKVKPK
ncbi:MAG: hypothetical protein Q7S20_13475 [Gemmatimonadaceae bacterium]|nr:hypothetical protein [Gemmatimonadaceae bacterium]